MGERETITFEVTVCCDKRGKDDAYEAGTLEDAIYEWWNYAPDVDVTVKVVCRKDD